MSKQLKLLFAVGEYRPYGGMQRTMIRIAQLCQAKGHHVDLYCAKWHGDNIPGIHTHVLELNYKTNHGQLIELGKVVGKLRKTGQYDCIVGFSKLPHLDIYYGGDPCFAEKVRLSKPKWVYLLPRYRHYKKLEQSVFDKKYKTEILLIAHKEQAEFSKHYGTQAERFHCLPAGINKELLTAGMEKADPEKLKSEFNLKPNDLMVICVGSGFRPKGVDRAILALKALPESLYQKTYLFIIGDGNPDDFIKLAKKLNIKDHVIFTGGRPAVDFFVAADILFHPAYNENTGTIILESLVCGTPALVTEVCGFANHVEAASAGLVCPEPFSQEKLNSQLEYMLSNPEKRKTWGANGLDYCAKTDIYSLIEKATEIILRRAKN